ISAYIGGMKVCSARVNALRLHSKQRVVLLQKQEKRIWLKLFSFIGGNVTTTTRLSHWKRPRVLHLITSMFFVLPPWWNGGWVAGQNIFGTSSEQSNLIR